jgi:hypothetical protein
MDSLRTRYNDKTHERDAVYASPVNKFQFKLMEEEVSNCKSQSRYDFGYHYGNVTLQATVMLTEAKPLLFDFRYKISGVSRLRMSFAEEREDENGGSMKGFHSDWHHYEFPDSKFNVVVKTSPFSDSIEIPIPAEPIVWQSKLLRSLSLLLMADVPFSEITSNIGASAKQLAAKFTGMRVGEWAAWTNLRTGEAKELAEEVVKPAPGEEHFAKLGTVMLLLDKAWLN